MFDNEGKLHIFEEFRVDPTLPKFNIPLDDDEESSIMMSSGGLSRRRMRFQSGSGETPSQSGSGTVSGTNFKDHTWMQRILFWFLDLYSTPNEQLCWRSTSTSEQLVRALNPNPELTVRDFFKSVKNQQKELEVVDSRVRGYEAALERAQQAGQTALVERLQAGIEATRSETQLHAIGLNQVLLEETIVEFVKKSPRGLRLDWIRNFTRVVPDEVLAEKVRCDDLLIFDNYVILHYDPEGKSWAETRAEIEDRKDPILFGLIKDRRQLYFVGEWVDEYCDLTLDQIADVLGKDATEQLSPDEFVGG